jgi:ubiquinone/menaquinone biosynthesis C-methylase UbiE
LPSERDVQVATQAFDAIAGDFDARFQPWRSVAAQRRAIRTELIGAFPPGARLIEIGGGTGDDALWLARQGYDVLMTDASPAMVAAASAKGVQAKVAAAEDFCELADELAAKPSFDGAYSVFAALNCASNLRSFAEGTARVLRPGAPLMLVVFGTCCPGEMLVETLRGRPRNAFRRFRRGDVPARLGGREFTVRYHRRRDLERMLSPWFRLVSRRGIGIFVPPSAAEPWISSHLRLLGALEAVDRLAGRPLAPFGDHILYRFERTGA